MQKIQDPDMQWYLLSLSHWRIVLYGNSTLKKYKNILKTYYSDTSREVLIAKRYVRVLSAGGFIFIAGITAIFSNTAIKQII